MALLSAASSMDHAPPASPLRIAFCGNSYMYYNDMPRLIENMAAAPGGRPAAAAEGPSREGDNSAAEYPSRSLPQKEVSMQSNRWNLTTYGRETFQNSP